MKRIFDPWPEQSMLTLLIIDEHTHERCNIQQIRGREVQLHR